MTSRNWVKLFLNTLGIGGLTTVIVGFVVHWKEVMPYFTGLKILDIISTAIWMIVMGFLFSVISQMGFFAYLTIHRFGLGITKSVSLWNGVQVVLLLFTLFDLVYLRYQSFAKAGDSLWPYIALPLFLVVIGIFVAWLKAKKTNSSAFIPTFFFMIIATVVEWVPVLRVNNQGWLLLMGFTLLACNAYQILILHKLNAQSELQRQISTGGKQMQK